jgi:2-iminobutanoate/2-iminopropanoate deaminase
MKILAAVILGLATTAANSAAPLQYFPAPALQGRPAPFSSAVRAGDVLYLSGQIGIGPDGKLPTGIEAQSRQAMDNIAAVLKRAGLGWGDVFHCTAMLSDMTNWPAFNTVYVTYFAPGHLPARSAIGANGLALGALLEVECQAHAAPAAAPSAG